LIGSGITVGKLERTDDATIKMAINKIQVNFMISISFRISAALKNNDQNSYSYDSLPE
jgi:hypothetical protein